jgi:hypothetical protein
MHKNATKCNETLNKWYKNKHGASKIMDTLETYHQSIFQPPGLAAGQAQLLIPAYNHGVAMAPYGRASHAPGIDSFSTTLALTLAPFADYSGMASTSARMNIVPILSDVRVQTITRENSLAIFGRIKQELLQRRGRVFILLASNMQPAPRGISVLEPDPLTY